MYLSIMGKPSDEELLKYPSVHLTSIHEWDPSVLDYSHPEGDGEPLWACDPQHLDLLHPNFDTHGLYTKRAINTLSSLAGVQQSLPMVISSTKSPIQACKHKLKPETPDFDKYRPYFGWVNTDTIRATFKHTTQWGASVGTFPMRKHLKSRNPALNIPRRHEAVATDTVYSDTSVVDYGVKQAQLFVGKESLVSDIYPMRSSKQFINTLEDNIRRRGAMDKLISDSAKNEISHKVQDILRAYNITDWQSEPHHQNQNPAEWRYRTIKAWTNTIMNRTGAPAYCWLLTLQYVCYILNHISTGSLGGQVPLQVLYGITPDISIILLYTFYQPIFYATHDQHYPSESEERAGYWVGFLNIVVIHLPIKSLMLKPSKLFTEMPSGPELSRIQIKGLLMMEGRKIISLTKIPLIIQLQIHQTHLLSISSQGMMMVQHQASPYQSSIQKILLEGLSCYPLETMGRH